MKQEKLDIQWICDTRADMISQELLVKMREAGCKTIWFGVESGSPRILEKINKHISLEQTEKAFKMCRKEDIQIACSFILGVPSETIQDMEATLKFAKKLNPELCQFNIFIAYPDSSLYEEILQSGNYDKLDDFLLAVKSDEFDFKKLIEIQRRFHKEFTRSPKRILWKTRREGPVKVLKQGFKILSSK
jgi:radical SAM superfamily enzyme YgiQ (UPF0313 family)